VRNDEPSCLEPGALSLSLFSGTVHEGEQAPTSERDLRLVALVSSGRLHSFRSLARELGISHEWTRQLVRGHGLTLPEPTRPAKPTKPPFDPYELGQREDGMAKQTEETVESGDRREQGGQPVAFWRPRRLVPTRSGRGRIVVAGPVYCAKCRGFEDLSQDTPWIFSSSSF
jgi:hypothetical protein